jgi:glyoxylase-like metal-dependent hydrolase (beta-lactamase superfamily II)
MPSNMILEVTPVGPIQTNAFIVGCKKTNQGAIIDPGDEARRLILLAETHGLSVDKVLITHGHVDHVGGVGEVKKKTGAEVWMNEADLPLYERCVQQARMFGIAATEPPPLDGHLNDGDEIAIGELRAKVIATPGHSEGGVSIYFEEQGVVFVGDTLFAGSIGRTDLPGGSMEVLLEGIRDRLLTLPDDTRVYCGHGPATTVAVERRSNPFVIGYAM